jgi:hypothetical protein
VRSLSAYPSEQEPLGFFRIFATPPGGYQREITMFRDVPVKVGTVTTQDPFTEQSAELTLPQATVFDAPGEGDLDWLVANCDIDIVWQDVGGYEFDWRWEGYIASYSFTLSGSESAYTLDLKGALYGLDDYLAKPRHPRRPIPYEILIAQAFDQTEHPAHLGKFRILFPEDWDLRVPEPGSKDYMAPLRPWGIRTNAPWTGFTSRTTGGWDFLLTNHVQGLLSNMFWHGGAQWSIRNRGRRRPELYLRRIPEAQDDSIIEIILGAPGVTLDGSRDFTQRAEVIYGSGTDEAGIAFSNIQISPDGRTTFYKPFAYSPRMWPRGKSNPSFDKNLKPKEVMLAFQNGVDEVSAQKIAMSQYHRFSEPGVTGTITLTTDPRLSSGQLMPRLMIRGGQSIRIWGLFGVREGVMAHITQASADFEGLTTTLTFDTKYRDQLTVAEVRARTRDALTPLRALQVGKYSNTIQDLVIPWSYQSGSGIVPTAAKEFFNEKLPANATFPFEEWTRKHPPKNPSSQAWYIRIGPTDKDNSSNNWSAVRRDGQATMAIPIRMSQAGSIRLTQLAAYDRNGNVLPVKFHYSVYSNNGISEKAMPVFPGPRQTASGDPHPDFPKYLDARNVDGTRIPTSYQTIGSGNEKKSQAHPFYKGGWESVQPDGTRWPWGGDPNVPAPNAGLIVGWGNYYEPAGFTPGRFSKGASRTGMLQDDTPWSYDLTDSGNINIDNPRENVFVEYAGMLFVMIYCDDQDDEPVFFMGRFIRVEPGQS